MANTSWASTPRKVDSSSREDYLKLSDILKEDGSFTHYHLFDLIEGQYQIRPDGSVWKSDYIIASSSSEILAFQKIEGEWYILFNLHSTVLRTEVNKQTYSQLILEQFVVNDDDYHSVPSKLKKYGYTVEYLAHLIGNSIIRHMNRAPELSNFFWAILQEDGQCTDPSIKKWPLAKVKDEFQDYILGKKEFFFGYELPLETISSLSTFFCLFLFGEIILDSPNQEKNLVE